MSKCYFSSGIDEFITCSNKNYFDDWGFPEYFYPKYPCFKFRFLVKNIYAKKWQSIVDKIRNES